MKKIYFLSLIAMLFCCLGVSAATDLKFSNVSLTPGSKLEVIAEEQQITFNTNMDDEIGYMLGYIMDETANEQVLSTVTVYDPNFSYNGHDAADVPQAKKDPHFTFICPSETKLIEGHTYSLVLSAYADKASSAGGAMPFAQGKIQYEGATPAYVGSKVQLLSITPDLETFVITSADNCSVTLHFSDKVRMDVGRTFVNTGSGTSSPLESIKPGTDVETINDLEYSADWTLTPFILDISDGTDIVISATAYDKEGLHVSEGIHSTGVSEDSYYTFTVANDLGRETFDIALNANQEKPQSLSSFIVSNASGIAVGYDSTPAVLYQVAAGGEKTKVAEVTWNVELEYGKSGIDDVPTSLLLMLNKPVTKAGNYVLSFPRGYFKIGTGMLAGATAATDVEYTIAKDLEPYQVEFTPSGDDEVTSLSEVLVSFVDKDENSEYKYELGCDDMEAGKAYFFNEQRELVGTASMEFPASWDDAHSMNFILKNTISAPGKYTMVVPDGSFLYNVCGMYAEPNHTTRGGAEMSGNTDDDDDEGIYNNALIVKEFTVVAGSAENVTAEYSIKDNATVSKMESIKVTFKGATTVEAGNGMAWWKGPKNYLTNSEVSGTTVTLYPTEDMWDNSVIEKNGTYTLTLPEGYFVVNGNNWPAITITFTVDAAAGISNVEMTDANGQKVAYTLDGKRVNAAKKGVFIVNGKKVILK